MRNTHAWRPSKFRRGRNDFQASDDLREVGAGSRVIADLCAHHYSSLLREHAHGLLLDLGCGKCPLYEMYKDFIADSVCVDWTNSPHGSTFLDVVADLNQPLPFRDATFDTVVMTDVLEHLYQPFQSWAEISRILKSGGKVLIGVPFLYWIHEAPHDYFRYTEFALRRMATESGLQLVALNPVGGVFAVMLDLSLKSLAHFSPRLAWAGSYVARPLARRRAISTIGAGRFPLGYTLVAQK